jgi:hypothetical protein
MPTPQQAPLSPRSALDARVQAFMSSTDERHVQLAAKFRKLVEKVPTKRTLSSSSEHVDSGFCKLPSFQEFAGPPVGIQKKNERRTG